MPVTELLFPASNKLEEASPQDRRTCLDFDRTFPAITKTAACLRDARDLNAVSSLVEIFLMCARSTLHEIHRSFLDSHSDTSYELSKAASEFLISLLHGKTNAQVQDDDGSAALDTILDLADMIIANLKELTRVALRITRDKKPLPAVPSGRVDSTSSTPGSKDRLSYFDYELVDADVDEESYPPQSYRLLFGSGLRGLFKINSSMAVTSSDYSASSPTLVNSDVSSSGDSNAPKATPRSKRDSDVPYVLRQSTYFMPSGTVDSDSDIESPTIDDLTLVRSSQSGELKGASFAALVRMLTSRDAVLDPDLVPSFFSGFRFFSSVELLFGELKSRFDEKPPDSQSIAELKVWTKKVFHTRIRVGKILLLWLTDYWQPDADGTILGPLHIFALQRLREELPNSLATPILEMIDSRMTGDELYTPFHHDKNFKRVASHDATRAKIEPTGFSYPDEFGEDIDAVLALFSTEIGKEEFVQQLTAIISAMFHKIKPRDVVTYWHTHSDSELGPSLSETTSFARSLAMFVTHSILTLQQRDQRCQRLEFWVNVATICLHYRNYFGSHCVFAGITHSAINRLKETILDLSKPVKMQFRRLDQFFSGHLNHALVRKAMDEKTAATVPLLVPLKKDIIGIKHVPPMIKAKGAHNEQTVINLVPFRVLVKTIRAMESALIPYGIPEMPEFGRWLRMTLECYPVEKEETLCNAFYEESRRMEPKAKDFEQLHDPWDQYFQLTKQGKKVLRRLAADEVLSSQRAVGRKGGKKSFQVLLDAAKS